jgi:hypothetical protein
MKCSSGINLYGLRRRLARKERNMKTEFRLARCSGRLVLITAALGCVCGAFASADWQQMLESNWISEERVRAEVEFKPVSGISTGEDAAGGCDGVKDGRWGFHTDQAKDPWWQVDLGERRSIARVVIWNRCESASAAERATNLMVRLSIDGKDWQTVYQHDGSVFFGFTDQKPLLVELSEQSARFVRVQLPGTGFLHLDEVEVFGVDEPEVNLAIGKAADQVSTSRWSSHGSRAPGPDWLKRTAEVLSFCERLAEELREQKVQLREGLEKSIQHLLGQLEHLPANACGQELFVKARAIQRELSLSNPLLDFDAILFAKRVPSSFSHMSDQYYGWWSRPGGGVYVLRNFRQGPPTTECLTDSFPGQGSFLRPTLSYDGSKVLFAWCKYYPGLAEETNKLDKANVPEDAFYHLFEVNIDGTEPRQLTRGKYDNFDGRYLPDGRIVFLSTRRGAAMQVGRLSAGQTLEINDAPDCYVRCGGGPERPVAVYTLHTMNSDGADLTAISPFEMFEWTPEIAHDGSILYSRWDYVDRDNMPYMGLWAIGPDGSNPRIIYGNFTRSPHCAFEARPVPNSNKIVFTASAHHAQTKGSLVLLDPSAGTEGNMPVKRLTPEVPFPEIEGWPKTYYAGPWPLSERFHLVSWGPEGILAPGPEGWNRWHAVERPRNSMALYLFDAEGGGIELLYQDPDISCFEPMPLRARKAPPVLASHVDWDRFMEGRFLLADVYHGLRDVRRGEVKALRIVGVPPKTHPTMDYPKLGITVDDPGKCVFGTVPVEEDGSAFFHAPAGVTLFFQALDERGMAVQTMRSATHVQPGQTLSCIGCHEHRQQAPPARPAMAALREPSRIAVGPEGSWPMRFDRLVQPVLDRHCASCHQPGSDHPDAAKFDLTAAKSYDSLVRFGKPSLHDQVWAGYRRGSSVAGDGIAKRSALLALLDRPEGHKGVELQGEERDRLITWMDTYAQRTGSFSDEQEDELEQLRRACAPILIESQSKETAARALLIPSFVQRSPFSAREEGQMP